MLLTFKRLVIYGCVTILLVYVSLLLILGNEIFKTCSYAKQTYSGNCVEAIGAMILSDSVPFKIRNDGIWSLGQIRDQRSLNQLRQLYTGVIPDREPLDKSVSQYELRKALSYYDGAINIFNPVWTLLFQ